jgi:hypothetical protein
MSLIRKSLVGAMIALLFAGCSSVEVEEIPEVIVDKNYPILPTAGVAGIEPGSRVAGVLSSGSAFTTTVFRANANGSDVYAAVTALPAAVNTSGALTFDEPQYYQAGGEKTALLGVHPIIGAGATWDGGEKRMTYTLDGKTDIMATPFVVGSKNAAQPALVYAHYLSQIKVSVYAESAAAAELWGDVEKIEVVGRKSVCTLTLPATAAGAVVTAAYQGSTADFTVINLDGSDASNLTVTSTTSGSPEVFGYCMFAPEAAALSLKVKTAKGGTKTVSVPSNEYVVSTAYAITLKMTLTDLISDNNVTVTNWTDGGSIAGDVELN